MAHVDGGVGVGDAGCGAVPIRRKGGATGGVPPGPVLAWGGGNCRVGIACTVAIASSVVIISTRLGRTPHLCAISDPWARSCAPNVGMRGAVLTKVGVANIPLVSAGVGAVFVGIGVGDGADGALLRIHTCVDFYYVNW